MKTKKKRIIRFINTTLFLITVTVVMLFSSKKAYAASRQTPRGISNNFGGAAVPSSNPPRDVVSGQVGARYSNQSLNSNKRPTVSTLYLAGDASSSVNRATRMPSFDQRSEGILARLDLGNNEALTNLNPVQGGVEGLSQAMNELKLQKAPLDETHLAELLKSNEIKQISTLEDVETFNLEKFNNIGYCSLKELEKALQHDEIRAVTYKNDRGIVELGVLVCSNLPDNTGDIFYKSQRLFRCLTPESDIIQDLCRLARLAENHDKVKADIEKRNRQGGPRSYDGIQTFVNPELQNSEKREQLLAKQPVKSSEVILSKRLNKRFSVKPPNLLLTSDGSSGLHFGVAPFNAFKEFRKQVYDAAQKFNDNPQNKDRQLAIPNIQADHPEQESLRLIFGQQSESEADTTLCVGVSALQNQFLNSCNDELRRPKEGCYIDKSITLETALVQNADIRITQCRLAMLEMPALSHLNNKASIIDMEKAFTFCASKRIEQLQEEIYPKYEITPEQGLLFSDVFNTQYKLRQLVTKFRTTRLTSISEEKKSISSKSADEVKEVKRVLKFASEHFRFVQEGVKLLSYSTPAPILTESHSVTFLRKDNKILLEDFLSVVESRVRQVINLKNLTNFSDIEAVTDQLTEFKTRFKNLKDVTTQYPEEAKNSEKVKKISKELYKTALKLGHGRATLSGSRLNWFNKSKK